MKNVLITRSQDKSSDLVELLSSYNYHGFAESLLTVQKSSPIVDLTKEISAIIVTSSNSCNVIAELGLDKNILVFAVGKITARSMKKLGFNNIVFPQNYSAQNLKKLILETSFDHSGKILYFRGEEVTLDFKEELSDFDIEDVVSYKVNENANFSQDLLNFAKTENFDQVLLFSLNSAQIFFNLAKKHNMLEYFRVSKIVCLSDKILELVQEFEDGIWKDNSITFDEVEILKNFYD